MGVAGSKKLATLADAVDVHRDVELGLDVQSRLSLGLPWLDACVGGTPPGSLVVVAGRTGTGKSFFSLLMLASARVPALYVSLEDSVPEVGRRVAGLRGERLGEVALFHPHNPRLSAVITAIRTAVDERGAKLVVIDYLQLLRYDGEVAAWSQPDQIHNTLLELKALSRELGFVLVLNVQIRRPQPGYEMQPPTLFELKDSSSIENSAEVVVLLFEDEHGLVEARVAKSKFSSRRAGRQLYARDPNSGWLVESDEPPLYAGEEEAA